MSSSVRYVLLDRALGAGMIPDVALRVGSRIGIRKRLAPDQSVESLVRHMSSGPIAERPEKANQQHYELAPEFMGLFLGPWRKYSCCLWEPGVTKLATAEEAMLELTCRRAGITDGMDVLDLGCGWGALSLWIAERYPSARVLAVSNSHSQREWIASQRDRRGLTGLEVVTADVNDFNPGPTFSFALPRRFDRVVSVEMFEHLRNWAELLARIAGWLKPDGRAFVHVFSHRRVAYRFEGTWAAERFFTAGTMPSHDLLLNFDEHMNVTERWAVPGTHYARTLKEWLRRLDDQEFEALRILRVGRSEREARELLAGWRLFLISTAEIWGWRRGREWMVSHYLLEPRGGSGKKPLVRDTYSG